MHNKMKKNILMVIVLVIIAFLAVLCTPAMEQSLSQTEYSGYCLSNRKIRVAIDEDGSLSELCNLETGHNYASGALLWRLYYDCPSEKEIEISAEDQTPDICIQGDSILISYDSLVVRGEKIAFSLDLAVVLEDDKLRFCSSMTNNEAHSVIRELHYPLLHGAVLPQDHKLYTAEAGGRLYDNPQKLLGKLDSSPYKKPEQFFRQKNVKYGAKVFMNCFGLLGREQGLYFGSHDATFQDTWHGLRAYKGESGKFDCLEFGFFKYPHCFCGESWACEANVVAPYSGSWHKAADIYREWVDSWWEYTPAPKWVQETPIIG